MARAFALEEEVENAFDAYFALLLPGTIARFTAGDNQEIAYPCVQIFVKSNDNANESGGWNDHRAMAMDIVLATEAKAEVDGSGNKTRTVREMNMELREAVMVPLSASDSVTKLNATGHARISLVVIGVIERQVVGNIMETRIPLALIV